MEKLKRTFFDRVKDTKFIVYRVSGFFNETATLSGVTFKVKEHTCGGQGVVFLSLSKLFNYDASIFEPQHLDHLRYIKNCRRRPWPPHLARKSESQLMLCICSEILVPLSRENEVFLETRYHSLLTTANIGVEVASIGIGSVKTWHGTPDARVRGASVVVKMTPDDETDISDGTTNLPQAIATCVISSFTERKLHPRLQSCVPTILFDEMQFRVIMYDCEMDVLLISEAIDLETRSHLSQSAMTVLWLVLNHRYA